MERLAGTLQSELSELTRLLTEHETSATAKQEGLKVRQFIFTPMLCPRGGMQGGFQDFRKPLSENVA